MGWGRGGKGVLSFRFMGLCNGQGAGLTGALRAEVARSAVITPARACVYPSPHPPSPRPSITPLGPGDRWRLNDAQHTPGSHNIRSRLGDIEQIDTEANWCRMETGTRTGTGACRDTSAQ